MLAPSSKFMTWRTPAVVLICGAMIAALGFGPRSTLGLFLTPMTQGQGWGREVFALALALQMLLWGAGTPIAGAIADRYGAARVLIVGAVLYVAGLLLMAVCLPEATTVGLTLPSAFKRVKSGAWP